MRKRVLSFMLLFLVLFVTACTGGASITGLSIADLSGSGTEADPYQVEMTVSDTLSYTVDVTKTGEIEATLSATASSDIVTASLSENTLTIVAVSAGEASVVISVSENTDVQVYLDITVSEESTGNETVDVTSIFINADEGSGTLSDPYVITTSTASSVSVSYSVRPTDADDKTFTWVSGTIADSVFSEATSTIVTLTDDNSKLTVNGISEGTVYYQGTANDGSGIVVYIKVNVEAYVDVEGITIGGLEKVDGTYSLVTAVGTQWNMTGNELARKDSLLSGEILSGLQAPSNLTYWPTLTNLDISVSPENASNQTLVVSYSVDGIVQVDVNSGEWTALSAGSTVVTISSYANSSVTAVINVEVQDSLYTGILESAYDEAAVSSYSTWDFDSDHGSETQLAKIHEWNLVMVQTTTNDSSETVDNNQKAFYLGASDRIYGICLESNLSADGDMSLPTALMWNKVQLSETATSLDILIGPNDKLFGEFRIVMVTEDGTVYELQAKTGFTAENTAVRYANIEIPTALRGQTVALVVESYLTETDNNAELQIKGIWINDYTPVTEVTIPSTSGEYGQGSTFDLNPTVSPTNASYPTLTYSVDQPDQGVTVDANGQVSIALNATVGTYVITVTSTDNAEATVSYNLTVVAFVETTSFAIDGIDDGSTIYATYGSGGYGTSLISFTDGDRALNAIFNQDASLKTYSVSTNGTSASISNGNLVINGIGSTTFTLTATNTELSVTFTVVVEDYAATKLIEGITSTAVDNKDASTTTVWDNSSTFSEWVGVKVDASHSNSKVPSVDNDSILFESHSVSANTDTPVALIWNKVSIGEDINSLILSLRSHDDDRILESNNFRVLVLSGENYDTVTELVGWTTVANRWTVENEIFTLSLDVSAYAGEDVVIVIESTGSLQNNGNYPLNSNSAAGAYLHLEAVELSTEVAPSLESQYTYRLYVYSRTGELDTNWTALSYFGSSSRFAGLYDENGDYLPLVIQYAGALDSVTSLTLPFTSLYIENSTTEASPLFYTWGLYPALNDSESNNSVTYEILDGTSVTLVDGVLTPVAYGDTTIRMGVKLYNSDTYSYFTFTVTVTEEQTSGGDDEPVVVTEWLNKDDIVDNWTLIGTADLGVGEGADLVVGSETGWSAWEKEVTLDHLDQLTFTARVFVRDGETYPEFVVLVNGTVIRAIGATEDYVYVDTEEFQSFTYDLSAYEGQTVTIQVGITTGTHAVVGSIALGQLNDQTSWLSKDDIVDNWTLTGTADLGVGEGADLVVGSGTGWSSWSRVIYVSDDTAKLTFTARVFVRDGETYPEFVILVDGIVVRAMGASEDYVYVDTEEFQTFTYDLSAFIGDYHTIEVGITTGTHAVVGSISVDPLNEQTSWLNKDDIVDNWTLTGTADLGVGEGADLVVGTETGWSSWSKELYIGSDSNLLTFTARVFHRDGETYPEFVVKIDGVIVQAIGVTEDYVYVDTDEFQTFTYDLNAYVGDYHTVEIGITIGTHAVVGSIEISSLSELV